MVHAAKQRGRTRSRILYWFRTPPSVRVGRAPLDEDAIRLIEEHNPDVEFDWTRMLKGQETVEPKPQPEPERRANRPPRARESAPQPRPPAAPPTVTVPETGPDPITATGPDPILAGPAALEMGPDPNMLGADEPASAALSRLGPEGLLRLRARHAEVLARISEKITDPPRRDELKSQAERLNPDTWVTDADVTAGLEQYETVFESLRSVVGRRRKRRKRRSGTATGAAQGAPAGHEGAIPAQAAELPDDQDEEPEEE